MPVVLRSLSLFIHRQDAVVGGMVDVTNDLFEQVPLILALVRFLLYPSIS